MLIAGAPGAGESTLLANAALAANEIAAPTEGGRVGVVVLDLKGDPQLPEASVPTPGWARRRRVDGLEPVQLRRPGELARRDAERL